MVTKINSGRRGYGAGAEAEALFRSLGDAVIVTDAEARISRINQRALDILGYRLKDVMGKWFPTTVIAVDQDGNMLPVTERAISQVFLTGKPVSARSFYRHSGGNIIPVDLTASPVMVRGRPVGAIETFRDVSRELALERAKDEFVSIASHQLRTPATAVKQYLGLLLEGYSEPLSPDQRLFLERAYESNERQLNIVQEILRITQMDLQKINIKLSPTDLGKLTAETAAGLKGRFADRGQKLLVKAAAEPVVAKVDAGQIRSALENLLENASNYSKPGKTITLTTKSDDNRALIIVRDQGVGIAAADFPRLFQKFSRIPNPLSLEISGTGLGLYWVARIIQLHGGEVTVKSSVGKGSTFTICLPLNS